jgi:replication-associated recombination protein RarA
LILISATTENPYFEVIAPLLSRARIFIFQPLTQEQILLVLHQALQDKERGLGAYPVSLRGPCSIWRIWPEAICATPSMPWNWRF